MNIKKTCVRKFEGFRYRCSCGEFVGRQFEGEECSICHTKVEFKSSNIMTHIKRKNHIRYDYIEKAKRIYADIKYDENMIPIFSKLIGSEYYSWQDCYDKVSELHKLRSFLKMVIISFTDEEKDIFNAYMADYDNEYNVGLIQPIYDSLDAIINSTSDIDERLVMLDKLVDEISGF